MGAAESRLQINESVNWDARMNIDRFVTSFVLLKYSTVPAGSEASRQYNDTFLLGIENEIGMEPDPSTLIIYNVRGFRMVN